MVKNTYKSGRVIITDCLGISIRFQNGIGLNNPVFKIGFFLFWARIFLWLLTSTKNGKIGDDFLGILSFSSSRFTSNQHWLIFSIGRHLLIGTIRNSKEMRWHLIPPLTNVELDNPVGVNRVPLVWVDDNTEKSRVSLKILVIVSQRNFYTLLFQHADFNLRS